MKLCPTANALGIAAVAISVWSVQPSQAGAPAASAPAAPPSAERHLKNIRQLTSGRQNAEAYFSFDGTKLIFQSTNNWM
jgi:TolB protein